MEKSSMLDCDRTVELLLKQEMGFLLLESDKKSMFEALANETSFKDKQVMFGCGHNVVYHLYPLLYKKKRKEKSIVADLMKSRATAIKNVFVRWTACGYNKHHAKDPFASKAFNKYLDDIEFNKADYMLLQVQ